VLFLAHLLSLFEDLSDASNGDAVFKALLYHGLPCALILLGLFIFVPLHREGFPRTRLPIGEYCGVETLHDLADEASYLQLIKDFLLAVLRVNNLVEAEVLPY
jgi:hypothetical protein